VVVRREDSFKPRDLSTVALALAMRGARDAATVEFVRTEALKLIHDFEPLHCAMLLEAFRRWGVFDRSLVDLVIERLSDEIDRFSSKDVVEVLGVLSRLGLARGFLLRRICSITFDNLLQFTPRELVRVAYALAKMRFMSRSMVDDFADAITPETQRLSVSYLSQLLFALAMTDARHQVELARVAVSEYAGVPGVHKSTSSLADFCWSVLALDLKDDCKAELEAALAIIFERPPPQNRVPLMKLHDIACALELMDPLRLDVSFPREWKAACDDADRFEMDRLEDTRLHNEIVMRLDELRGTANGLRWQLRMLRNQQCGPYRVDMFDEDTKIALDVEIIGWPTSRRMKHRLLKANGYRPVRLEYWDWRRARTEEDQMTFLEREITNALERRGTE